MTTLEDLTPAMLRDVERSLGDSLQYRPSGGGSFLPLVGFVTYGEILRTTNGGMITEQAITVEIPMDDEPTKPNAQCRVMVRRAPGQVFKPVNVQPDTSGFYWRFELAEVHD